LFVIHTGVKMFHYGEHYYFLGILFYLVVGHCLCDFPLQNDYLAKAKDPENPLGANGVWKWALFSHSMIHAGSVAFFTHSMLLGVFEGITHALIDHLKCRKAISFGVDQSLHIGLKILWAYCVAMGFF
jgi:hypothetical protein